MNEKNSHEPQDQPFGHEADQIAVGKVVRVGVGLSVMVVVSMIGMVYLFRGLNQSTEIHLPDYATPADEMEPAPPHVAPDQSQQLAELRAAHRRILNSYGWVDKEAGVARVPIERAIEMVTNNLPAREDDE